MRTLTQLGVRSAPNTAGMGVTARVSVNTTGVGVNTAGMGVNTAEMGVNTAVMAVNTAEMGVNTAGMGVNTTRVGVGVNTAGVSVNTSRVGVNTAGVGVNTEGVRVNTAGVRVNTAGVGVNTEEVGVNTEGVGVNTAGVGVTTGGGRGGTHQRRVKPKVGHGPLLVDMQLLAAGGRGVAVPPVLQKASDHPAVPWVQVHTKANPLGGTRVEQRRVEANVIRSLDGRGGQSARTPARHRPCPAAVSRRKSGTVLRSLKAGAARPCPARQPGARGRRQLERAGVV
eukprot:scaffold19205_cov87-Isochrysis_galbana.AAC.3